MKLVQSDLLKVPGQKQEGSAISDDSDTEPHFVNHQLNSSAEEIIQELSEEEDCDRSGDLSDQSDEQISKVAARLDRSVKATDFSEDSNKIAAHFERDDPKYNIDIARKLFHGPNAISM